MTPDYLPAAKAIELDLAVALTFQANLHTSIMKFQLH